MSKYALIVQLLFWSLAWHVSLNFDVAVWIAGNFLFGKKPMYSLDLILNEYCALNSSSIDLITCPLWCLVDIQYLKVKFKYPFGFTEISLENFDQWAT